MIKTIYIQKLILDELIFIVSSFNHNDDMFTLRICGLHKCIFQVNSLIIIKRGYQNNFIKKISEIKFTKFVLIFKLYVCVKFKLILYFNRENMFEYLIFRSFFV